MLKISKLQSIINNIKDIDLGIKLSKENKSIGEIEGIKIYKRPVPSSIIACIMISPETNLPVIFVDDLFFKLNATCMKFVLLHELGHYKLGHFLPKINDNDYKSKLDKIKQLLNIEYPQKEQDADYFAMYKMDSVEDARNSLIEINNICEEIYSKVLPEKKMKKIKAINEKRLYALNRNAIEGAYYINEKHNIVNDIPL